MKPSRYHQLTSASGIVVQFYGNLNPLVIPSSDLPISVEEVCERCALHLAECLSAGSDVHSGKDTLYHTSSLMLPMFSLIDLDHKVWMSPRERLMSHDSLYQFFFRIRFCIFLSKLTLLQKLDQNTWEYLLRQLQDDFINDRLHDMYKKRLERSKLLGFVVVGYFIPRPVHNQQQTNQHMMVEPSVTFLGLKNHLPKKERLNFKWPWPYYRLYRSVKEEVTKYKQTLGDNGTPKFKHTYMNGILDEVGKYGSEVYEATELKLTGENQLVDIVVDPFFSRPAGIYFGMVFVCQFPDVDNLALHTSTNQKFGGRVEIVRRNGPPKTVCFKEAKMAESFVSCVDGYCRMLCNYYYSLSSTVSVEPPSLAQLRELRAFGPMLKADAETELQREMSEPKDDEVNQKPGLFLIHQSVHSLCEFVIVQMTGRSEPITTTKVLYDREKTRYQCSLKNVGDVDCCGDKLLKELRKEARMIRPKYSCSLSELFQTDDIYYYQTDAKNSAPKTSEPKLFKENAIDSPNTKLIGDGDFTKVSMVELCSPNGRDDLDISVAIKQLKSGQGIYSEDLQEGMWKLMKLQSSKTFVRLHGYMVKPPFRVLLEYAPLGDLQSLLVNCPKPFSLRQVASAMEQITYGLTAMEEMKETHGNLRCRNILAKRIGSKDVLVKIADPGLETLYNMRSLTEEINIERLPWLAVERFENLKTVTLSSEIYAFATTCWEMLSKGQHPREVLSQSTPQDLVSFYQHGDRPPRPIGLEVKDDKDEVMKVKDTIWQLIEDCWKPDPENRPSIKDISRSVYAVCDMVQDHFEDEEDAEEWEKLMADMKTIRQLNAMCKGETTTDTSKAFGENTVIHQDQLEIDMTDSGKLGEGFYGQVRKAKLYETSTKLDQHLKSWTIVAVKQLKKIDASHKLDFLNEIDIASKLRHENIVKVLGVCCLPTQQLVMEYVERGSVIKYLQRSHDKNLSITLLARFCIDVAQGMKYLHSQQVLHRDLAARNVLLSKELKAKITDFGLAKILKDKDYYRGRLDKEIPYHWCSPEAIVYRRFTKKGDVWSYGVLMWEIFSLGLKKPHLVSNEDHQQLPGKLLSGQRLPKPDHCPKDFYDLMKNECWKYKAEERTDFDSLVFKVFQLTRNLEQN